ncbi:hypothetical protein DFR57_1111 [Saliterribacillus persicus]|uniref:Uncharacterized protein n=2 Tax=Saliterribacillus persicus TaxID=930114 RepID=A0A368XGY6_9BACI|nr:hypothetical protein DFR57_1111 [Saliterribacillus persicus]
MICPNCRGKNIGIIGQKHYYCWNCAIELTVINNILHIHEIEHDGTLSSLDDLFSEEERRI